MPDDFNLNIELGPQFSIRVEDKTTSSAMADYQISLNRNTSFTLIAGVKSSSLYATNSSTPKEPSVTAGQYIPALRAVNSEGMLCDMTEDGLSRYVGISTSNVALGFEIILKKEGLVVTDSVWTEGLPLYILDEGILTHILPLNGSRRIGYATKANEINLDPMPLQQLSSTQW